MAGRVLSSFRMRATITLEGELAERIERLSREKATSFEALARAALREGLEHLGGGAPKEEHGQISYTRPVSLGGCVLEGGLDDISGALAAAEGEGFK